MVTSDRRRHGLADSSKKPQPRIVKVDRRRFLGRVAATAALGAAGGGAAGGAGDRAREQKTLDRFRLFVETRAFTHPVRDVYPALNNESPRLIAVSTDRWLGIWALDKAGEPRFKGRQRRRGDVRLARPATGHRRPEGEPSTVSEDGNVVAWLDGTTKEIRVAWANGRIETVSLPTDRGATVVLGLGADGAGLAVAMELGGILVFDLREEPRIVAECADSEISVHHVCEPDERCDQWSFAPCLCDVVNALQDGEYSGAAVSNYDRQTGTMTTSTLPCGAAVPAGAVCVCDCVAAPASTVNVTICTCDLVCTCDAVATTTTYTYTYWYPN